MRINLFFILIIILSTFMSCVDTIELPDMGEPGKIMIECELSPPYFIQAKLSTTGDLQGTYIPTFPTDAKIRLYSKLDEEFVFQYNPQKRLYEVKNGRLKRGMKYTLHAEIPQDDNIQQVSAITEVPGYPKIADFKVNTDDQKSAITSGDVVPSREVTITLPDVARKNVFLELDGKFIVAEKVTENNEVYYEEYSDKIQVKISGTDGAALQKMTHRSGILIDGSRLKENEITFTVSPDSALPSESAFLKDIEISLSYVTEPFYMYHQAKSKLESVDDKTIVEPVITYTNIENGFGVFASFTTTTEVFSLQQ